MASPDEQSTMNDALREWISEDDQIKIAKHIAAQQPAKGTCHVCKENAAAATCIKCGGMACPSCYFTIVGLCQKCLSKDTVEKWKNKKTDWQTILGVDWID